MRLMFYNLTMVILVREKNRTDMNEAFLCCSLTMVIPDMGKQYENELNSAEDDHIGSLSNYNSRTVRQIKIKIIQG